MTKGIIYSFSAAVLFGVSTPLAKLFLPQIDPVLMAGLLYLGSGVGLGAYYLERSWRSAGKLKEAAVSRQDAPWLAGAILAGGVAGPVMLMLGLAATPASSVSLLLNLEGVLTAVLAWFVFKENFDAWIAVGMVLISAGGLALSFTSGKAVGISKASFWVVAACLAWAIDNNLTRKVSAGDPVQIAMLKGLVAGGMNTGLGFALGAKLPNLTLAVVTGLLGLVGYGLSLTLFVLALRHLGTARTGAYFSIAPFVGAGVAIVFLEDKPTSAFWVAALFMSFGVWLHLSEHHAHEHRHEPIEHEHLHEHDEHHQHVHSADESQKTPHSHRHAHPELVHYHPHYPDIHHRHEH